MTVPDQVPVMSLPNAVLFPRVLLPLHIFEPRYKEMLADCLAGNRMFAIALLQKGWDEQLTEPMPYPIATVGVIRACVGNENGTSNLVLQGVARVRLCSYVTVEPYRVARVSELHSELPQKPASRAPLVAAINRLIRSRSRLGQEVPEGVRNSLLEVQDLDILTDLAGYTFLKDEHVKQQVLETLDVRKRQKLLIEALRKQVEQQEFWKHLQGDLPNDHVGFN
jgi:Lon protease-like protein